MITEFVDLGEFSFSTLPLTGFYEVLGKRGTGKTTWTKHILQFSPTAATGMFVVMCGSQTIKQSWSEVIYPMYIQDPSPEYLNTVIDDRNETICQAKRDGVPLLPEQHLTLVLDDIASNKKIMRCPALAYLASNSRHLHMSIFVLAQYHCQIPSEIRNQNDVIFMLSTHDKKTIHRVHSEYASCLDKRAFEHVVSYCTDSYGMLVIDNRSIGSTFADICFSARIHNYKQLKFRMLGPTSLQTFVGDWYFDVDAVTLPSGEDQDQWQQQEQDRHLYKQVMGNRKIYQDRKGTLVIRTV